MKLRLAAGAILILCACGTLNETPVDPTLSDIEFFERDLGINTHNLDHPTAVDPRELAKLKQPDLGDIAEQASLIKNESARLPARALTNTNLAALELAKILDTRDALLLYRAMREFENQNPEATELEKSDYLLAFYREKKALTDATTQRALLVDYIEDFGYELNPLESKLYAENQSVALKNISAGYIARETTKRFWTSGLHNGNADAFRHCLWNVYMCSYTDCIWAKRWADAHEAAAAGQPQVEYLMDQYNNDFGRTLYASYGSFADTWVPSATWYGHLRRLGSDGLVATDRTGYRY